MIFSELLEKHYHAHLLSREYNHHVYTKTPALTTYSFHELGEKDSLVGSTTILPQKRLRIQQYVNIVDYIGSVYG